MKKIMVNVLFLSLSSLFHLNIKRKQKETSNKTPINELEKAKNYMVDYLRRCTENNEMD